MIVFHLDSKAQTVGFIDTPGGLDEWHKLTHSRVIDIAYRGINGKQYDIIIDDEGILSGGAIISAVSPDGEARLFGSLVVCNHDADGNEIGLTPEDMRNIHDRIATARSMDTGENIIVLILDE